MNLRQLEYFVAIAESGTISAAAKRLGVSQPPLSAQLRLLEEEVGILLVERGPRRLYLTEAGKLLYQKANTILALSGSAVRELRDLKSGAKGALRLGTISSCGAVLLEKLVPLFRQKFPHATFEIHEGNTYELLELLESGVIEAAVVRTPFSEEGVECAYLSEEPMIAAGQRGCFSAVCGEAVSLRELSAYPLICYRRMEKLLEKAFAQEGERLRTFCINDDARTCLMWAQSGTGVALVPRSIFRAVDRGAMEYREISAPALVTRMVAVRKRDGYASVLARGFLEICRSSGER